MERFSTRILQNRKRIRIKEVSAPSMEEAERGLINLLYQYLSSNLIQETKILTYHVNNVDERKFRLTIEGLKYTIQIKRVES
jgi:hypothetical protein